MLMLDHHFELLARDGRVKDYAAIAGLTGLSRARVTQIVNLTLLGPSIQEMIHLSGDSSSTAANVLQGRLRSLESQAR
jgi:hypothetical protein